MQSMIEESELDRLKCIVDSKNGINCCYVGYMSLSGLEELLRCHEIVTSQKKGKHYVVD